LNVDISKICLNSTNCIIQLAIQRYPDIKSDNLTNAKVKRLLKRLIRNRDDILKMSCVSLVVKCPLFVYYELKTFCRNVKIPKYYIEDSLQFDISEDFTEEQISHLSCIHKKVNSVLKSIDIEKLSTEQILYFLPMSVNVTFYLTLNFIEIFDMLSLSHQYNIMDKTNELLINMLETLEIEVPNVFTEENINLYINNKES